MPRNKNILLYPFSVLYGGITSLRNFLYNTGFFKSTEFVLPVICVGNITVGGTGKTPHTEYLIELLYKKYKISTLSRGYKRKSHGFVMASPLSRVKDIGDEPLQISLKYPEITVAVDSNRVRGINKIIEQKPETSVIILDDGYQHRSVQPGLSILLTDYERLIINDNMLPYGDLRENARGMNRADIIIVTKSPVNISPMQRRLIYKDINKAPYQELFFTSLKYNDPLNVFDNSRKEIFFSEQNKDDSVLVVTGIANPQPLIDYLSSKFREIKHLPFGDHHNFTEKDVIKITSCLTEIKSARKYIFTTEKDAVRLREFTNIAESIRSVLYYIPVGIYFLNDDKDKFDNLIVDYVRKNKRNNRFS